MVSLVEALPSEIIVNITSRLPVKSIINCTLVCKLWKTLIPNPILAKHDHTYFLLYTEESVRFSILYFDDDDPSSVSKDQVIIEMKPSFHVYDYGSRSYQRIHILGSCNGLVCFSQSFKGATVDIYLYNPVLGQSVTVPNPTLKYPWLSNLERYAFGFCPVTNHYKVLRSVHNIMQADKNSQVMIYTLGSPRWRHIGHVAKEIWTRSSPICARGSFHWIWNKKGEEKFTSIFAFNLATEEFGWSPPPPIGRGKIMYKLGYMDHCLVVTAGKNSWVSDTEVWMRKESTWSKNWVFNGSRIYDLGALVPVALSADGIMLVTDPHGRHLYSLDPKDKQVTPRAIISDYIPSTWSGVVPYDATLVSPKDLMMKDVPL